MTDPDRKPRPRAFRLNGDETVTSRPGEAARRNAQVIEAEEDVFAREAAASPELLREAPHDRPVKRLDEVKAAKEPVVRHRFEPAAPDRARAV